MRFLVRSLMRFKNLNATSDEVFDEVFDTETQCDF